MNKLILILNCDCKYGIGKKNGLLFELPQDMAFFRKTTLGHTVALGENTLLSFPGGKPLKNRRHIVISADPTHEYEGVENVHDFLSFRKAIASSLQEGDVYVIGGASIYNAMLPYCHEVLLTKVQEDGHAEVYFQNIDENPDFECVYASEPILDNGHSIVFTRYENRSPASL